MAEIAEEERHLPGSRTEVDLGRAYFGHMTINITDEGIIMDVFGPPDEELNDLHLGTVGMTFDEWAEWIVWTVGQ